MALLRSRSGPRRRFPIPLLGETLAIAVGAVDGYAASGDAIAGRHWDTKSVSSAGATNVDWGWAPATQIGAIAAGTGALMVGQDGVGTALICSGGGLFSRALAFKLAQKWATRHSGTPVLAQGHVPGVDGPALAAVANTRRETAPGLMMTARAAVAQVGPDHTGHNHIGIRGEGGYQRQEVAPGLI